MRATLPALIAAAAVAATGAPATTAHGTTTRRDAIRCFERHRLFVEGLGAVHVPARVEARARQVWVSFPFTPGESGLSALVFVEPSHAGAVRAKERFIRFSIETGHGTRAQYERFIDVHGTSVVGWFSSAHAQARRIVAACLGRKSD